MKHRTSYDKETIWDRLANRFPDPKRSHTYERIPHLSNYLLMTVNHKGRAKK